MLYPLVFEPIFKERVWGGRNLETLYGKALPVGVPVGESWEIADHGSDVSIVRNGPLAGRGLRWLMEEHREELLGAAGAAGAFPLLVKILDAQDKLSLQVHPPAAKAESLGGDPKTEMWFITSARPGSDLFVGLKRGVTRAEFERRLKDGTVADCFHRLEVRQGDSMFLPSGRVHAIGAGNVIFEIQQNSDTTYRVFDWNRVGLDGAPRELHVQQALESIDFDDFEPGLASRETVKESGGKRRTLVRDPLFHIDHWESTVNQTWPALQAQMQIIGVVKGRLEIADAKSAAMIRLKAGDFCLVPACSREVVVRVEESAEFLHVWMPKE